MNPHEINLSEVISDTQPKPCPRCGTKFIVPAATAPTGETTKWRCRTCGWLGPLEPPTPISPATPPSKPSSPTEKRSYPQNSHSQPPSSPNPPPDFRSDRDFDEYDQRDIEADRQHHHTAAPAELSELEAKPRPRCHGTRREPHRPRIMRPNQQGISRVYRCAICSNEISSHDYEELRLKAIEEAMEALSRFRSPHRQPLPPNPDPNPIRFLLLDEPIIDVVRIPIEGHRLRKRVYKPVPSRSRLKYVDDDNKIWGAQEVWVSFFTNNESAPIPDKLTDEELMKSFYQFISREAARSITSPLDYVKRMRMNFNHGRLYGQMHPPHRPSKRYFKLGNGIYVRQFKKKAFKLIFSREVPFPPPPELFPPNNKPKAKNKKPDRVRRRAFASYANENLHIQDSESEQLPTPEEIELNKEKPDDKAVDPGT